MKNLLKIFLLVLLSIFISSSEAKDFKSTVVGIVVGVTDGDTITVLKDKVQYKIRLAGIDCPEKNQDFGTKAKQFTSDLVFNKEVIVTIQTIDRYGRSIGFVTLRNGTVLNKELLKAGLAWHYVQYSKDKELQALEDKAREARIGLWVYDNPVPPWLFRKKPKKYISVP